MNEPFFLIDNSVEKIYKINFIIKTEEKPWKKITTVIRSQLIQVA